MRPYSLIPLTLLTLASACSGKGGETRATAPPADLAVAELCPPKPGQTPADLGRRRAACQTLADSLAQGKPLPTGLLKVDEKFSIALDEAVFRKALAHGTSAR